MYFLVSKQVIPVRQMLDPSLLTVHYHISTHTLCVSKTQTVFTLTLNPLIIKHNASLIIVGPPSTMLDRHYIIIYNILYKTYGINYQTHHE